MGWLPGSGCALWLQMDERQGNTAYDLSGNNNHGTIYGAIWRRGKIGYCLSFDGVDDYVNCGADPSLDITDKITIEVWIKPRALTWGHIVVKPAAATWAAPWSEYCLRHDADLEIHFQVNLTGDWWVDVVRTPDWTLTLNEWAHVVGVYDGSTSAIYLNGSMVVSEPRTGVIGTSPYPLTLGATHAEAPTELYDGFIDEARIYNRALSIEEIKAHYWYGIIPALKPP